MEAVENLMLELIANLDNELIQELYAKVPSGKKLRTKLILKIAGENENSVKLAAVVELIHMASLLHDDVIDDADTRRGIGSINALFGNKRAIMLGDILYSKAFFELTSMDRKVAQVVSNAVTMLSIGELLDVEFTEDFNDSQEKYYDMIYKKTASLIEAASVGAALISSKESEKFRIYGRNLGLAFQIIDDVLDIVSDSQTLGKPALNDFVEGKTTLPYIYLYEYLDENGKNRLKSLFKKELNEDESNWIKLKMRESSAVANSIKKAKELGLEALEAIKDENNSGLEKVIKDMIEREF